MADLLALRDGGLLADYEPPAGAAPCLLLDCDTPGDEPQAAASLVATLQQAPCPVLGLHAEHHSSPLAAGCDALFETRAALDAAAARIQRSPLAATVFVQVLRAIESLPTESALMTESLAYSTLQAGPEFSAWLAQHRAAAPAQATDDDPAVLMDRQDTHLRLTLNRASNRNGMNVEMRDALMEALQLVLADPDLTAVSLDARGDCFSTGGDLSEFGSAPDPATAHAIRRAALPGRLLARCASRVTVRVQGACVGSGIEFPAFAGRLVASPDAWFQLPELKFGLIPGAGGCVSISRRIGRQRTAWLGLTGKRINARQALDWGLVDAIESSPATVDRRA